MNGDHAPHDQSALALRWGRVLIMVVGVLAWGLVVILFALLAGMLP